MKVEIINQDGLFGGLDRNNFIDERAVLALKAQKESLKSLNQKDYALFDELMGLIEKLPKGKATVPKKVSEQPPKNNDWGFWDDFEKYQMDAFYWIGVDKFYSSRRGLEFSNFEQQWDGLEVLFEHRNKLKAWIAEVDFQLMDKAFSGVQKMKKERHNWIIQKDDPLERLAFAKAYAVFKKGNWGEGFLDFQTCPGSLANARIFESAKAIELAAKKRGNWDGVIVEIDMRASKIISEVESDMGGLHEVIALIDKKNLEEKLSNQKEYDEKIKTLIEKVQELHPELLQEVGLTPIAPKIKKRM